MTSLALDSPHLRRLKELIGFGQRSRARRGARGVLGAQQLVDSSQLPADFKPTIPGALEQEFNASADGGPGFFQKVGGFLQTSGELGGAGLLGAAQSLIPGEQEFERNLRLRREQAGTTGFLDRFNPANFSA